MNLADMLKTDWFGQVATATLATSATHGPETLRSVATVATVTVAITENWSAANDPTSPKALEPQPAPAMVTGLVTAKQPKKTTPDWQALDAAYQAHHVNCPTCIAAGKGCGLRCGTGAALWAAYNAVAMPKPQRAAHLAPQAKADIHPSLLTAANSVEIDTMVARLALFDTRGLNVNDAERLADKLLVRDREGDRRGACAECRHLSGHGPGRWKCNDQSPVSFNDLAGLGVGAGFVHHQLHHCPSREVAT